MTELQTAKNNLAGYPIADLIVGKAALLFVKCGIKKAFAKMLSEKGKKILEIYGLDYEYEVLTEKIINRMRTDICPMEKTVANTDNPEEAYAVLKNKLI